MLEKNFWSFFVNLYHIEGVESACTTLQSKYNINTNILFFCCWTAKQHYAPLDTRHLQHIHEKIAQWHTSILNPLKALHKQFTGRTLNKACTELYRQLVSTIIFAEQVEQSLMLQTSSHLQYSKQADYNAAHCALTNIFNYLKSLNITLHQTDLEKVYRIVQHCFAEGH